MNQDKAPNKRFPQELDALFTLFQSNAIDYPKEIKLIAEASRNALISDNPRVSLNKRFGGLKSAHPDIFQNVLIWLKTDSTKILFEEHGLIWAINKLINGFDRIVRGEKTHEAFNMNIGGRPVLWGFTIAEDAAIYALHLHFNEGHSIDKSKIVASNIFCTDKSNINKVKMFKNVSACEIKTQAQFIKLKYKDIYKF
ncbi:MAG: hypothetical protein V4545_00270 [Pseudomonadota bacterium]